MRTFADVISRWKTAEELGSDIGEPGVNVRAWRNRNRIPPDKWVSVVGAAQQRGYHDVTYELLARIAAAAGTLPAEEEESAEEETTDSHGSAVPGRDAA